MTVLVRHSYIATHRQKVEWWLLGAVREVGIQWHNFKAEGWLQHHVNKV